MNSFLIKSKFFSKFFEFNRLTYPFVLQLTTYNLQLIAYSLLLTACCLPLTAQAQKIAVIAPEKIGNSEKFAEKLSESLSKNAKILDASLSETAFRAMNFATPFNLTKAESKTVASAIGCDYFLLVKSENMRRSAYRKPENFESYASVFAVSSRTGRLVFFALKSFEDEKSNEADKQLFDITDLLATEIIEKLKIVSREEAMEKPTQNIFELPEENSAEAKGLRPPLPYRRIKPEYTSTAYFYNIEATVDVEIEVSETGKILKTEIVRWAGYGLDESVRETVLKMQWRPADRNGKTLPMRVLLRYNFKKLTES